MWRKSLKYFGYMGSNPSPTSYNPSVILRKNKKIAKDQLRYPQIIGSLMYLAIATRLDISFAVSKLSKFISNASSYHWHALNRVMRYLIRTSSYGIYYSEHPVVLKDIVIRTGFLMHMRFMIRVGICLPLEVVQYYEGLANKPF
jgi:hypothetical protein